MDDQPTADHRGTLDLEHTLGRKEEVTRGRQHTVSLRRAKEASRRLAEGG